MTYADKAIILKLSGVRPDELGFADEASLEAWIEENVIEAIEGAIHAFCGREWDEASAPPAVRLIANMAGANFLQWMRANAMGPLIKSGEWKLALPKIPLLTEEMKELLSHFKRFSYEKASEYGSEEIRERWSEV